MVSVISGVRSLAAVLCADADLLEAAAWLHDIGYTANLANTGSRALDGAATCATPSFVEIAFAVGGTAAHHSLVGRREMQPGEVLLLSERLMNRDAGGCVWLELACRAAQIADAGPMIPICDDQVPEGARACPGYAPGAGPGVTPVT